MPSSDPGHPHWTHNVTLYLIYIIAIAILGPLQFGYHIAELNAPQKVITCKRDKDVGTLGVHLPQCIPMTAGQFGLVSSIFTLGGLTGAMSAGVCSTRYGRVLTMKLATIFFIVGPIFETLATNVPLFVIGRIVSGLGSGAAIVVVPVYISEVAPPTEKGLFGAFTQVAINIGIVLTQFLGLFWSKGQMWRVILAVAGGLGVVHLLGLYGVIESPQWMSGKGKRQTAKQNLRRIRNDDHDVDGEVARWSSGMSGIDTVDEEEALLDAQNESRHQNAIQGHDDDPEGDSSVGVIAILRHPLHRPAVIAVVGVMLAQQLCGINSIIMYSVSILSTLLPTTSGLITVIVSAVNLIVTIVCAPLADRIGRKPCLLLSVAGMGLNSILLAISLYFSLKILSGIATLLFVVSFGLGLGPVPFILSTELVGQEAVGAAQSWALAANWIATFVVAQFFPILNAYLDRGRVFYVFAGMAAAFFVFVLWYVPESKGKKDADEVWGRKTGHD